MYRLRIPQAVRIVFGFVCLLAPMPGQVGTMTQQVDAKRADYDDAYANWSTQDVSRADLLKLRTTDAVDKIHKAASARERVQKTRQEYLTTLRSTYEKSAQDI